MLAVKHHELILRGIPLHIMQRPTVRGGHKGGLLSICAEEIQACIAIVTLSSACLLGGRFHQHRRAGVVPRHGDSLRLEEILRGRGAAGLVHPVDLTSGRLSLPLRNTNGHVRLASTAAASTLGGHLEGHDPRGFDPGDLRVLSVAGARHDLNAILYHSAAVRLQGSPFQGRPCHGRHVLHGEGEAHLARLGIPQAHVVASLLLPSLISHQVVPKRGKVEVPDTTHQGRHLTQGLVAIRSIQHLDPSSAVHQSQQ
mmetsp:Transcript_78296/g.172806  ORF Transcript_78296/g.172806 Transcript_78296/m.172806 type:complete len:255 (+) Transcript_78296:1012-1776(+)